MRMTPNGRSAPGSRWRSEEHTSELQSQFQLVCRLLLEKKKLTNHKPTNPQTPILNRSTAGTRMLALKTPDSQALDPTSPFFFNPTATTALYTLSLPDALPI